MEGKKEEGHDTGKKKHCVEETWERMCVRKFVSSGKKEKRRVEGTKKKEKMSMQVERGKERTCVKMRDKTCQGYFKLYARTPCCILLHFCPTHFFLRLNPYILKWLIFVRRRACVCDTFRFESPSSTGKKRSNLVSTPSSPPSFPSATTTIDFPECQERRGAKYNAVRVVKKASPAEGRRRLHKKKSTSMKKSRQFRQELQKKKTSTGNCSPVSF